MIKRSASEKAVTKHKREMREAQRIAHRGAEPVATGETIMKAAKRAIRRSEAPIYRLMRTHKLDTCEQTAAAELIRAWNLHHGVHESDRDPVPRELSADRNEVGQVKRIDILKRYSEWTADLRMTKTLMVVRDVLFEEVSFRTIDRAQRWRDGIAETEFFIGLRHFAAICGYGPSKWRFVRPQRKEAA